MDQASDLQIGCFLDFESIVNLILSLRGQVRGAGVARGGCRDVENPSWNGGTYRR